MDRILNTKVSVIVLMLLFTTIGWSQSSTDLPKITPHSPEVAKMGRYGIVPLNSSTGQMNYSIPIYTIEVGGHSWPITLNYNYGGLLLESKPSLTGLGWNLNATGAVYREIRSLPDEASFGYYHPNNSQRSLVQTAFLNDNIDHLTYEQFDKFRNGTFDGEPDKYTVSVAGINFSFKIDENGDAVHLSKHHHRVEVTVAANNSVLSIKVTSDNGTVYVFNEIEYTSVSNDDQTNAPDVATSWLLKSVQYPNNRLINFFYVDDTFTSFDYSAKGISLSGTVANVLDSNEQVEFSAGYNHRISPNTVKRKILDQITFPSGQVDFNLMDIADVDQNRKVYQSIEVKNSLQKSIWNYAMYYAGARDALTAITRNGTDFYNFEYYGINDGDLNAPVIPDFIDNINIDNMNNNPMARDKWQYYNGVGNTHAISIPGFDEYTADVEPSFEHTKLGALTKITYPTKGYSEIFYESNFVKTANVSSTNYSTVTLSNTEQVYRVDADFGGTTQPEEKESLTTLLIDKPTAAEIRHLVSVDFSNDTAQAGSMHFQIQMYNEDGCDYSSYYPPDFQFPLLRTDYYSYRDALRTAIIQYNYSHQESTLDPDAPPMCPELNFEVGPDDGPAAAGNAFVDAATSGGRLVMIPGTYKIHIRTYRKNTTDGFAEVAFKLQTNVTIPEFVNDEIGGVRVYQMDHFDSEENLSNSDFFNYNDEDGFSTGIQSLIPYNRIVSRITTTLENGTVLAPFNINNYFFDNYTDLNPTIGTPVYYRTIERYNGLQKEQGYQKTQYGLAGVENLTRYPKLPQGEFYDIGRVMSTSVYKTDPVTNSKTLVQKDSTDYYQRRENYLPTGTTDENEAHPPSLVISTKLDRDVNFQQHTYGIPSPSSQDFDEIKDLHNVHFYKELDSRFRPYRETSETLFEDGAVKNTTNYKYPPHFDYPNRIEKENSEGDLDIVEYNYPDSTSTDPFIADLFDRNQRSSPFLTRNLQRKHNESVEKLLNETRTVYGNDVNFSPGDIILLKEVYSKKEGTLASEELRVVYERYDDRGNVLQYKKENGIPVSFIWGFQKLYPLAKVENTTYDDITALLGTPNYGAALTTTQENNLRNGLPNAMITTYTYDPLVGVLSTTDPRNYTTNYVYEQNELNRLDHIANEDDHIVERYAYKYGTPLNAGLSMSTPVTTSDKLNMLTNTEVQLTASNIGGGSGDYTYEWNIFNQFNINETIVDTDATLNYTPIEAGTLKVRFIVTDNETGDVVEGRRTIFVYDPLATPNITTINIANDMTVGQSKLLTAENISGGSPNQCYKWYINGVLQTEETGTTMLFTAGSAINYTVIFEVADSTFSTEIEQATWTTNAYERLTIPTLVPDKYHAVINTPITFTAGNIANGSGTYVYSWSFVNNDGTPTQIPSENGTTFVFYPQNDEAYTIRFAVEDPNTGTLKFTDETVYGYQPLNVPLLFASKTEIIEGETVNFTTGSVSGGSGNFSTEWLVDTSTQTTNVSTYNHLFNTDGTYTVIYRVTDTNTQQVTDQSKTITVYNPMTTAGISAPDEAVVETDVTFSITVNNGSQDFSYLWTIVDSDGVFYNNTASSFTREMGYNYYGNRIITCRITDNQTDEVIIVTKTVDINGAVLGVALSRTTLANNQYYQQYRLTASGSNGSGSYSYRWYRDGSSSAMSTQSNITIYLDCDNLRDDIRCVLTDNSTGETATITKSYFYSGAKCNVGGPNQ